MKHTVVFILSVIFRSLTSDLDDLTVTVGDKVKLQVVFGDITNETTDAVVNTTDFKYLQTGKKYTAAVFCPCEYNNVKLYVSIIFITITLQHYGRHFPDFRVSTFPQLCHFLNITLKECFYLVLPAFIFVLVMLILSHSLCIH